MSLSVVHRNDVLLVGRVEVAPTERVLPSGDLVVSWRMSVQRPAVPERRTLLTDSVDCVVGAGAVARRAASWQPGDVMEVAGSLRRRFWHGAGGVQSRCEVEVLRARRLARAGIRPESDGPAPTIHPRAAPRPEPGDAATSSSA